VTADQKIKALEEYIRRLETYLTELHTWLHDVREAVNSGGTVVGSVPPQPDTPRPL
jgi:hypothetical protein